MILHISIRIDDFMVLFNWVMIALLGLKVLSLLRKAMARFISSH
jgi:hypothetical protein